MIENCYREYKLATILNVVTGINKLSTSDELKDILMFMNGEDFANYQMPKIALDIRNKILLNNREFINVDITSLNILLIQNSDKQLAIKQWLREQEKIFGSSFLVSRQGEMKRVEIKIDDNQVNEEKSQQYVKKMKKSVELKISI